MANQQHLSIILSLQDKASKELAGFQGKLESLQPTFKKMALIGTATFGALSAGILKTTKDSAIAEGSWNKFNTVFAEGSDEMISFIDELRKTMPTATHEIARMSADLQDLLIPMGLGRKEAMGMTQEMVVLANKLGAFNDVDPTEVMEAFKSGLAGSSEPLRRFGINALDSSIELEAMNTGLLEAGQKFSDLDPILRSQIRAQALVTLAYKQSGDAIEGFEANNDSLIRRQQNLQATMREISVTIGNVFLPVIDDLVKAITPVIEKIGQFAEENPIIVKWVTLSALAIAGLVATFGALGLIIPLVIAGIGMITAPVLIVIGTIGLFVLWIRNLIKIMDLLKNESSVIWEGIKIMFKEAIDWIVEKTIKPLMDWIDRLLSRINAVREGVGSIGGKISSKVSGAFSSIKSKITGVNDAIISPDGNIITTHPDDYLIATKNPHSLAGGGQSIVITGNTLLSEDVAEQIGDMIMRKLKLNTSM